MPEAPNQTPQPGTGDQTPAGTDTTSPGAGAPQPSPIDYYQKFAASSAEAQRLYQENVRLQQALQAAQQPVAPRQPEGNVWGEFSDAVIDRKEDGIKKFAGVISDEVETKVLGKLASNLQKQQRVQASLAFVQNELKDLNSPVARQTMERYQQIAMDPSYGYVENDLIDVGTAKVNPHLLRIAALEVKAKIGTSFTAAAADARNTNDSFVEPATPPVAKKGTFDARIHMTEDERATCQRMGQSYDAFWKHLDTPNKPSLRDARLKAGRPVRQNQI